MSQRLPKWDLLILRQGRPIMLHQRFGKTNLMTTNLIFGHSVVLFMRWRP